MNDLATQDKVRVQPLKTADASERLIQRPGSPVLPILMSFVVGQGALLFGFHIAYSSSTEKYIQQLVGVSDSQMSFLWSLVSLGAVVGCLLAGRVADAFGRRTALALTALPFIIGSLIFAFWLTFSGLCLGRFLNGMGVGASSVLAPLYITETAPTHLRGQIGSVTQLMLNAGILLVNVMGLGSLSYSWWWRAMILMSAVPALSLGISMITFAPETPRWFFSHNLDTRAKESLMRLRGTRLLSDLQDEVDYLIDSVRSPVLTRAPTVEEPSWGDLFRYPTFHPFMIGLVVAALQQWGGINAMVFHTAELFTDGGGNSDKSALLGGIWVGISQLLATCFAAWLMDKAGRKMFLMISSILMCISCAVMGYLYVVHAAQSLKIVTMIVYMAGFSVGWGPVPFIVIAEIYPAPVRGMALSLSSVVNWMSSYGVTMAFTPMMTAWSSSGIFFFYSGVGLFASIFVFWFLPETKGKSLEDIEKMFK